MRSVGRLSFNRHMLHGYVQSSPRAAQPFNCRCVLYATDAQSFAFVVGQNCGLFVQCAYRISVCKRNEEAESTRRGARSCGPDIGCWTIASQSSQSPDRCTLTRRWCSARVLPAGIAGAHTGADAHIRVVNVADLMALQPSTEHPHGLSDVDFDAIFTRDKPVIFAFHGNPRAPLGRRSADCHPYIGACLDSLVKFARRWLRRGHVAERSTDGQRRHDNITTRTLDRVSAFRRSCRQGVPRTASSSPLRRGRGKCVSRPSVFAKQGVRPGRRGRRIH
jgi:XFP C-terminal domain